MECTPCSIHLERCLRWFSLSWLVPAMKSSTKTSRMVTGMAGAVGLNAFGTSMCSYLCGGSWTWLLSSYWIISRAVSDAVQKKGGNSHHPICSASGATSSVSSSDTFLPSADGRT